MVGGGGVGEEGGGPVACMIASSKRFSGAEGSVSSEA